KNIPININHAKVEDDDDDETDEFDPLGTNRTRHLSNSLKSLEKNIWKEDDYFNL
ncbi:11270_t:CDS:1, partial [Entrophospora sp. SA101]